jgi:hypothetical protein
MLIGRFGGESKLLLWSDRYDLTTTSWQGQSALCQKHVTFVSPAQDASGVEAELSGKCHYAAPSDTLTDWRYGGGGHVLFGCRETHQDRCT